MTKATPSVGYIRMSTDKQETSPEQQRVEILKYAAAHDYKILKWFEDLGISGDKTEKRIGFQRMIAEAAEGRFKAILCWDQDRFGRFDSLESGYWIHPLRQHHVQLVTCTDGVVDWTSFAGRMLYGMKQEGKHQYLVDLSNNVARRMKQIAQEGLWVTGKPPVGYVLGPERKLVLGQPEDVQLVKDVFESYLAGSTTRELSKLVHARGYRSPKGLPWSVAGVTAMLKNQIYVGTLIYGKRQLSKYQLKTGQGKYRPNKDWVVVENAHEPIISKTLFDQCQRLLKERKRHTSPNGKASQFVLSGLLRCSHCDTSMHGDSYNNCTHYTCGTYKSRPGCCERYNVRQAEILPVLLQVLRMKIFKPEIIQRLQAEMIRKLGSPNVQASESRHQLTSLEKKIELAEARLLEVSKDMIPRVESLLRQLEEQRETILAAISERTKPNQLTSDDIKKRVNSAIKWFGQLEKIVTTNYNPEALRSMLRQFIDKVELRFERTLWGESKRRYKCSVTSGVIHFRFSELAYNGPLIRLM